MNNFKCGVIGLKILDAPSIAKCVQVLRKYESKSILDYTNAINNNEFVMDRNYLSTTGITQVRKCYRELKKLGAHCEVYETYELDGVSYERSIDDELLDNIINSHKLTEKETQRQIDLELKD